MRQVGPFCKRFFFCAEGTLKKLSVINQQILAARNKAQRLVERKGGGVFLLGVKAKAWLAGIDGAAARIKVLRTILAARSLALAFKPAFKERDYLPDQKGGATFFALGWNCVNAAEHAMAQAAR